MLTIKEVRDLTEYINQNPCLGFDLRTKVLYPLLDEIFSVDDVFTLRLSNGLAIEFPYRSNIAKEILLRSEEIPAHAWEPMTSMCVKIATEYKAGSVVIGGAYFGDQALISAKTLSDMNAKARQVICVEPNDIQRAQLTSNAVRNSLSQYIATLDNVLWSSSGEMFGLEDSDSHAAVQKGRNATIRSTTIEEIADNMNITDISLIQLDIEGSEEEALLGASNFLSMSERQAPIVITEIHSKYTDWSNGIENSSLVQLLLSYGYTVFGIRDAQSNWELGLKKPELLSLKNIYLEGPPHGFNLIASKDKEFFSSTRFTFVDRLASPKYLRHRDPELHMPINAI